MAACCLCRRLVASGRLVRLSRWASASTSLCLRLPARVSESVSSTSDLSQRKSFHSRFQEKKKEDTQRSVHWSEGWWIINDRGDTRTEKLPTYRSNPPILRQRWVRLCPWCWNQNHSLNRTVRFKRCERPCLYTSTPPLCWNECLAVHPLEVTAQGQKLPPPPEQKKSQKFTATTNMSRMEEILVTYLLRKRENRRLNWFVKCSLNENSHHSCYQWEKVCSTLPPHFATVLQQLGRIH